MSDPQSLPVAPIRSRDAIRVFFRACLRLAVVACGLLSAGDVRAVTPAVSATESFALALDANGKVYAWGSDADGQLGQGRTLNQGTPTRISGLPPIKSISVNNHVLALDEYGQVWSWGYNSEGQLGARDNAVTTRPDRVIGITGMVRVAAGYDFSVALKADGTVWAWGNLTTGTTFNRALRQVAGLTDIVEISAGFNHLLALRKDGTVWAVGGNDYGQIGNGQVAPGVNDPIQVSGLANVKSISAGVNASLALLANGEIHIWGRTPTSGSMRSPTAVPGLGGAAIAASRETFAGIVSARSDGTVWTYNYTSGNAWAQVAGFAGMSSVVDSLLPARLLLGLDASGRLFAAGANHHGGLGQGNTASYPFQAIAVPGFESTRQVAVSPHTGTVLAIKSDGSVWFWGRDYSGQSGSGASIASSFPLAVAIPASVKTIATGRRFAIAVDTAGNGWGWGFNDYALLDASSSSRSTPLPVSGMTNVSAIAAGGFSTLAFAKSDGTAYSSSGGTPRQMTGLSNIVSVAAGESTTYYLNSSGTAFASGANRFGQLGDGTDVSRSDGSTTTVRIDAPIAKIVAAENRAAALMRDGRVFIWGADFMGNSFTNGTNVPVALGGVTDAVDVAAGQDSLLVRRANGVILAWGNAFFPAPGASAAGAPATVSFGEPVQAMAVASGLAFLVSGTGVAWGWGYSALNTIGGNVGDGTYVFRGSPVVILNAGGSGSLDGNDWFLDLDPSSRDTIPAAAIPKALATAKLFGGNAGLAFEGTVRYKSADLGKRVGNHVLALVPPAFFNLVKTAPGTASAAELAKSVKADQPLVLAQLTPQGWTNVQGQLIALSQGVASSAGAAANILSGVDSAKIPGARFCVGYGESPDGMLSAQSLREVLVVEGTTSTASGVPCVLSGVYVSGPPSSVQSSPVTFSAMVVGISPSGTVQFLDGASSLGSPVTLSAENPAVGRGAFTTSSLSIGTHSIGASYGGDVQNPAATSALPQLHVVSAPLAQTRTDLAGPASSSLGDAVTFIATITGNSPGGQVQFKDAGTNLGAPVPVVGGTASIRLSTLGLGTHSITAVYSGDALNTTGTSSALSHVVANALSASVELTSSTNPSSSDAAITLSVAVSGSNPTGSVTLREGAAVLGSATLSAGRASFTLALLPAGMHVFHADYGGDASNTPATSAALFQQVNVSNSMFGASVRTIVASYYQTILGRTADAAGLEFWAGEAARVAGLGADVREVFFAMSIAFFSSSEYVGRNTTDAQYITDLYRTFFIRDPDAAGLAYWLGELAAVQSRGALLNSFLFSAEFSNQMTARFGASAVRPEVNMTIDLFRGTFGRLPDSAGFNYWLGQIRAAQCGGAAAVSAKVNEVAGLFFNSGEYVARARSNRDFMGDVYNAYLRRGPGGDAAGFGFWVGQLASQTRDQVRAAFVPSAEFQSRVAAVVAAGCSP